MSEKHLCELCGKPMPEGEEMFKYHGYSCDCPKSSLEPKIIYLQLGDDADITEFKKEDFEADGISWCWERIFSTDIEYISKKFILEILDEMMSRNEIVINFPAASIIESTILFLKKGKYRQANKSLTELKQKLSNV